MIKKTNNKGFTIIEVVIYLALFAIIIGGTMVTVYQIIQSSQSNNDHIALQEEANFLLGKIDSTLTGATSFTITQDPATLFISHSGPAIMFNENLNNLQLTIENDPPVVLNSSRVLISNLLFTSLSNNGVTIAFTLSTTGSDRPISQSFSFTKYLRK